MKCFIKNTPKSSVGGDTFEEVENMIFLYKFQNC